MGAGYGAGGEGEGEGEREENNVGERSRFLSSPDGFSTFTGLISTTGWPSCE